MFQNRPYWAALTQTALTQTTLALAAFVGLVNGPAGAGVPLPLQAAASESASREALITVRSPLGLPPVPIPDHNPLSAEKIALGRKLFFDVRLSPGGRIACATCHVPGEGFTQNGRATPTGAAGRELRRNAPTILNAAYMKVLHHDGGAPSLEMQILGPLFDPAEMANPTLTDLTARLRALPDYRGLFEQVFGRAADIEAIGQAIASYERSLLSGNSPFDRWRYGGEAHALPEDAQVGFTLFTGKARCASCHTAGESWSLFTDQGFHNTGIGFLRERRRAAAAGKPEAADLGRQGVTHDPRDRFKYRTPTLRNAARTAPYMHDGSLPTLQDVLHYYNGGGAREAPGLDPALVPLGLTEAELLALQRFLESLTGGEGETCSPSLTCTGPWQGAAQNSTPE